jgi:hypothetical protein
MDLRLTLPDARQLLFQSIHCHLPFAPHSKLCGQALVDVEGTWHELTGVINKLAANLTSQVRNIAHVTTKAVSFGDLSKQIDVDACGEILDLKNTVNSMVVRLQALAEVTRVVTLEVSSLLGGQAHVPDVEGVWHRWYSPLFLSYVDFAFPFLLLT